MLHKRVEGGCFYECLVDAQRLKSGKENADDKQRIGYP